MVTDSSLAIHLLALRGSVVVGPNTINREESHWLCRASTGDEAAYRWILDRYRERVIRVAAATLGRQADAEDAAQESFIRAFRNIQSFEKRSSFYTWLSKITVRVCLDLLRSKSQHELSLNESLNVTSVRDSTSSSVNSILVWQILNKMSPPIRAALVLRELDGLEYDEIAKVLNVPVGTVRSRLNAARIQFKSLWLEASRDQEA